MGHLSILGASAATNIAHQAAQITADNCSNLQALLVARLQKPQRHRLLHGFPLAASMPRLTNELRTFAEAGHPKFEHAFLPHRPLLVGVLPHAFCNPKIAGCGFCTFPHETFSARKATTVVDCVQQEITSRLRQSSALEGRPVKALYFGGATANLTPADAFRKLCRQLNSTLDLRQAEVTLEGVPANFINRRPLLLDILQEELQARHFRISMGVQSFSTDWQSKMGRTGFGDSTVFAQVVQLAHSRNMTVSGDLLFNLPGQSLSEMLEDVTIGCQMGFDQLCLYHLVLFRGLGTAWSREPELLSSLPDNDTAVANWQALRTAMFQHGFYQATLTNFERAALESDTRRFIYEVNSFEPGSHDMLGFGPSAISYSMRPEGGTALKTMNPESSVEYMQANKNPLPFWNRYFDFDAESFRLLYATRQLSKLTIQFNAYRELLGTDALADFADEWQVLARHQLIEVDDAGIRLTARGMFFSDTVASVLSHRYRATQLDRSVRIRRFLEGNQSGHM
jgi:coproporphyrinogen III oxidase-like Fe-S oxidoreductase